MDYETKTYIELAALYKARHGTDITPEALMYRVKTKGLTKEQAVAEPKSARGKTSQRKKLRSGRKPRRQCNKGLEYVYLHIDVAGTGVPPIVRYVGKGTAGRCLNFHNRVKPHQDWIKRWFKTPNEQVVEMGVAPVKLKDLSWIDLNVRQMIVLVSHPFEGATREEGRLTHRYNTEEHNLFNRVLFTGVSLSIPKAFQSRPSRKKAA